MHDHNHCSLRLRWWRAIPFLAFMALFSGCMEEQETTSGGDAFLRDLGAAIEAMEAAPGPCVMCGTPSASKDDRKTLTLEGQFIEFCSESCAGEFYQNPKWREYKLDPAGKSATPGN